MVPLPVTVADSYAPVVSTVPLSKSTVASPVIEVLLIEVVTLLESTATPTILTVLVDVIVAVGAPDAVSENSCTKAVGLTMLYVDAMPRVILLPLAYEITTLAVVPVVTAASVIYIAAAILNVLLVDVSFIIPSTRVHACPATVTVGKAGLVVASLRYTTPTITLRFASAAPMDKLNVYESPSVALDAPAPKVSVGGAAGTDSNLATNI
jgi:hypothetical protein